VRYVHATVQSTILITLSQPFIPLPRGRRAIGPPCAIASCLLSLYDNAIFRLLVPTLVPVDEDSGTNAHPQDLGAFQVYEYFV